ncbi:MAG: formate dehydrogenase subunit delta [Alkalilacustris sp.]
MSPDKLIGMANQIAAFHATQSGPSCEAIAAHINDFWEPRLRKALLALADQGDTRLHPAARAALPLLRLPPA